MSEWTGVITNPLGLAGFALFLIFGQLARVKRSNERRWLAPAAAIIAIAALAGGLVLDYVQVTKQVSPSAQVNRPTMTYQQTNTVQQTSSGNGSPNVQGVQGDVTITVDQSKGKTDSRKTLAEKPK